MDVLSTVTLMENDQLHFHEAEEPYRLKEIAEKIKSQQYVKHPILVTPLRDGQFMVLDGLHRSMALWSIGCKRVPVQVLQRDQFAYSSWDHCVPTGHWLATLYNDPTLPWVSEHEDSSFIQMKECNGETKYLYLHHLQENWLHAWHKVTSAYSHRYKVKRMVPGTVTTPEKGMVLIKYGLVDFNTLERIVLMENVFPAGVTRFETSGRLLNLNIPLHLLLDDKLCVEEWNSHIEGWRESIRLYTENIYLCEA